MDGTAGCCTTRRNLGAAGDDTVHHKARRTTRVGTRDRRGSASRVLGLGQMDLLYRPRPPSWVIASDHGALAILVKPRATGPNIDTVIVTVSVSGMTDGPRRGRWMSWCDGSPSGCGSRYPGAPNGRVPGSARSEGVRWYTTTGLVDRQPCSGRTALYGTRHLLQIVAVKRARPRAARSPRSRPNCGGDDATTAPGRAVPDELIAQSRRRPTATGPARPSRSRSGPTRPLRATVANGSGADTVTKLAR